MINGKKYTHKILENINLYSTFINIILIISNKLIREEKSKIAKLSDISIEEVFKVCILVLWLLLLLILLLVVLLWSGSLDFVIGWNLLGCGTLSD